MRKDQGWRRRMTRVPRILKLMWLLQKTSVSIPDCMIVRSFDLKRKWASNSWLHDCQKREPKLKTGWLLRLQNVQFLTAWLSEAWIWKKIERPIPDCMIVRNLILKWKLNTNFPTACLSGTWFWHETEATFHDWTFLKKLRGLLNTSGWLVSSSMLVITASHEMYDMSNR